MTFAAVACLWSSVGVAGEAEWQQHIQAGNSALSQSNYPEAQKRFEAALKEAEAFGEQDPRLAITFQQLALVYMALGRSGEAMPLIKRAHAILQQLPEDSPWRTDPFAAVTPRSGPEVGAAAAWQRHDQAGTMALRQSNYPEAQKHFEAALKEAEAFGAQDQRLGMTLSRLATVYFSQGRYEEAEMLLKRALAIWEMQPGAGPWREHPAVMSTLQMLGAIYKMQGRSDQADLLTKRAEEIQREMIGRVPKSPYTDAGRLLSEANTHMSQGRYAEAESLVKRGLEMREKQMGSEHPIVGSTLIQLAGVYSAQSRYAEAEASLKRALSIWEKAPSISSEPSLGVAVILWQLADVYSSQGRHNEAEQLRKRVVDMAGKSQRPGDSTFIAASLQKQADEYISQGRYAEAEPILKRALSIWEKQLGGKHPNIVYQLAQLTQVYWLQGRYTDALDIARRAMAIYKKRAVAVKGLSVGVVSERRKDRYLFLEYVKLLSEALVADPGKKGQFLGEAFEAAEFTRTSDAARAVARMAARFAAGDDELARLVRHRQDTLERWQLLDSEFVQIVSKSPNERNADHERQIRTDLASLDRELAKLDVTLGRQFPEYRELTSPLPMALDEAQALLAPDEALIAYLVGEKESFIWTVRKSSADFRRVEITQQDLNRTVQQLRRALEPFEGMTVQQIRAFPFSQSHDLYQRILAPAEPSLTGVTHVFVVPDGALQSLPFGVLVTEQPKSPINELVRYRDVPWLAKKYALTTLPSASSLRALRRFAREAAGDQPFAGFGDPILQEGGGRSRGVNVVALFSRGAVADVNEVRRLPRLPETADELYAVAKALKANSQDVHLREAATETNVKRLDLSRYRVLAFATHGLMAGDFSGLSEPALVLTPPEKGTTLDDGLLTASEIAQLKLNADWVILSACNTAAADGTPGAEGLSGLAKAFFYAGSRALLVSHWAVSSDATVELTTKMLDEAAANPGIGRAEALRRSMLALMNRQDKSYYAHPMFWAPFMVVGEGGALSAQQAAMRVVIRRPEARAEESETVPVLPSEMGSTKQSDATKPEAPRAESPKMPIIWPVPAVEIFEGILRGAREVIEGVKKGVTDVLQGGAERR